jgi:hypothetical protein
MSREQPHEARMPFECTRHDWTHIAASSASDDVSGCDACRTIARLHILWKNNLVALDLATCREASDVG